MQEQYISNLIKKRQTIKSQCLKDWNVVVDLGTMLLSHAFRNPDHIPAFLLLQLQIGIENAIVKLLHKSVDIQFDLERRIIN